MEKDDDKLYAQLQEEYEAGLAYLREKKGKINCARSCAGRDAAAGEMAGVM